MRQMWQMCALTAALAVTSVAPSQAGVPVVFGKSWDPPGQSLQKIVDLRYGTGAINVTTDYLGAHPGDPDPWFWIDNKLSAMLVRAIGGNGNHAVVGWYEENGTRPVIDGVGDGVVFDGPPSAGSLTLVMFDRPMTRFGFYMIANGPGNTTQAADPKDLFTNRFYNEPGPDGTAVHAPWNGDVQALVFDVSRFTQPNTWLVCFEELDTGANPGPCCYPTDNDFNDFVFEVSAFGATPTVPMTVGALKSKYLK